MKANEAPEKIYILSHKDYSDRRIMNAFTEKESNTDIEYIRTNAFIEKATEWLKKNADTYTWYNEFEGESGMIDEFIDDFRKYMEGE